jgi:site-specific DNA-adenine methylase
VDFKCRDYQEHSDISGAVIYCDPPYVKTEGFAAVGGDFDDKAFWEWCSRMAARGNTVLVSEATLPDNRYIKSTEGYKAGKHNARQEYLILVKPSRG